MSASAIFSQLQSLVQKTKILQTKLLKICPSTEQWRKLKDESSSFMVAATEIHDCIAQLQVTRSEKALAESQKHVAQIEPLLEDLLASGQMQKPGVFRRNIITIYAGPKFSRFDSDEQKFRKEATQKRCESLRRLHPDSIVQWALAFPPTLWASGSMATDIFDCVLQSIEAKRDQIWPPKVIETLEILREDEDSLEKSPEYHEFLQTINKSEHYARSHLGKRRRIDHATGSRSELQTLSEPSAEQEYDEQGCTYGEVPEQADRSTSSDCPIQVPDFHLSRDAIPLTNHHVRPSSLAPTEGHREMKHMYTNSPAESLSKLPEPFKTAVQNSRLWKWERSQHLKTTGCWATLFPKDDAQDVSFTIWCGNEDGYNLIDAFGAQHAMSSYSSRTTK